MASSSSNVSGGLFHGVCFLRRIERTSLGEPESLLFSGGEHCLLGNISGVAAKRS